MIGAITENMIALVEGVSPAESPDRPFHVYRGNIEDAANTVSSDRRFMLGIEDSFSYSPDSGISNDIRLTKVFMVAIQYRIGRDYSAFEKRLHSDVDKIIYAMIKPNGYAVADSDIAIEKREPTGELNIEVDETNTSALVFLPFAVQYRQTF